VASGRKEDDNTTDQSDQLMSRFSDILCFVLFSSSVPSFLLLGFWSEREPAPSVYLYPTLTGSSSRRGAYTYPGSEFKGPEPAHGTPQEAARIHASRFNELFIYFQVDIDDRASPYAARASRGRKRIAVARRKCP